MPAASDAIILRAHAKLNLALAVAPPLPADHPTNPGMHPIASWMAPIDLHDDLLIEPAPASSFHVEWSADAPRPTPIDWPPKADLAHRAHRALEAHLRRPLPARITIRKRIPVGSGMGGGSSNAASALLGLNHLFNLQLPLSTLIALSRPLGSDIAFFLNTPHPTAPPHAAIVTALGDHLTTVPRIPSPVLLLFPPFPCPTGPVYRAFDALLRQSPSAHALDPSAVADLARRAAASGLIPSADLFNDLTPAARAAVHALDKLMHNLADLFPNRFHLTGSGSTLFALPKPSPSGQPHDDLDNLSHSLADAFPGLTLLRSRLLPPS